MKRWYVYILIGLAFGVLDWFFLQWLADGLGPGLVEVFGENPFIIIPFIVGLNYGIWLVPIIPVVIFETRQANSIKTPILAAALTWTCALFSYYAYYAVLLSYGRLTNLEHLNVFGDRFDGFWGEYWRMFNRIILFQFLEWLPVALIGGTIIAAVFWWVLHKQKQSSKKSQNPPKSFFPHSKKSL